MVLRLHLFCMTFHKSGGTVCPSNDSSKAVGDSMVPETEISVSPIPS